jgi:hypothetical protein
VASCARLAKRYDRQRRATVRTAERLTACREKEARATSRWADLRDKLRRG